MEVEKWNGLNGISTQGVFDFSEKVPLNDLKNETLARYVTVLTPLHLYMFRRDR